MYGNTPTIGRTSCRRPNRKSESELLPEIGEIASVIGAIITAFCNYTKRWWRAGNMACFYFTTVASIVMWWLIRFWHTSKLLYYRWQPQKKQTWMSSWKLEKCVKSLLSYHFHLPHCVLLPKNASHVYLDSQWAIDCPKCFKKGKSWYYY
jgi:hypothetical protein